MILEVRTCSRSTLPAAQDDVLHILASMATCLEVSPIVVLDGVVQVQVEAWLVNQDKAGHHIKAQGWDHQGSTIFIANVALARPKGQS